MDRKKSFNLLNDGLGDELVHNLHKEIGLNSENEIGVETLGIEAMKVAMMEP